MPIGLCDRCQKAWAVDKMWKVGLYGTVKHSRCRECNGLLRQVTLAEAKPYLTRCEPSEKVNAEAT